jgi:hypothetical protein
MTADMVVTSTFALDPVALLEVSKDGDGFGSVTSDPAGIDCGSTCASMYSEGTVVTLTATADSGSIFVGWGGACTNASGSCVVTMSEGRSVTATFDSNPVYLPLAVVDLP